MNARAITGIHSILGSLRGLRLSRSGWWPRGWFCCVTVWPFTDPLTQWSFLLLFQHRTGDREFLSEIDCSTELHFDRLLKYVSHTALLHGQGCLIFCFLWFLSGSEDENGVMWTEEAPSFLRKPKLVYVLNLFFPSYMCYADRRHGKVGTSRGPGLYTQTAVSRFLRASNFH